MTTSTKPKFVYVTYIASTVDKVWNALVDPELTREYWARHRNRSDWKVGSRWTHEDYDDPKTIDIVGKVVESSPPRRLVVTWASPADEGKPDKTSRVTYEIDPYVDVVRLRVTHDELEPDSPMLKGISTGWPLVVSALKTQLETGRNTPMMSRRWTEPPA